MVELGADVDERVVRMVDELVEAVRQRPDEPERRAALGMAYDANGLYEAAAQCYEQAAALQPTEPRYPYYLALARTSLGDLEGGLETLHRAQALDDTYVPAYLYRGSWLLDLGRVDEAELAFRRATELENENPAGWIGLARVHLGRQQGAAAVEILERWVRTHPHPRIYQLLGLAYRQQGELDRAREAMSRAGSGSALGWPDPWNDRKKDYRVGVGVELDRAKALLEAGRLEEAIELYEELRAKGTTGVSLFNNLSLAYRESGRDRQALEVLQDGVRSHPDYYPFRLMISAAYHADGDLENALVHLQRAIEIKPDESTPHERRAAILFQMSRKQEALAAFDSALTLDPENPKLLFSAAALEFEFGNWTRAAERAEQAVRIDPSLGAAYLVLGMSQAELGELPAAARALDRAAALQIDPRMLATARQRLAQLESARR